jgi:Tfp pilus assembly protein PilX
MNPYSFFRLIILSRNSRRYSSDNGGFALPMVIMVGLVLTVIGIVIMQRSLFQQNDSTSKAATDKAQNAAEAGVVRITNLLNDPQRRFLATLPACVSPRLRTAGQACSDVSTGTGTVVPNWQNLSETQIRNWSGTDVACKTIDSTVLTDVQALSNSAAWQSLPQGKFRLVGYKYTDASGAILPAGDVPIPDGGVGVLTVEGNVNEGQANEAKSRIEVKIPVKPGPPEVITVPGLWVTDAASDGSIVGNNTIAGDVLVNDCGGNLSGVSFPTGSSYTAKYTNLDMPAVPPLPAPADCNDIPTINNTLTLPRTTDVLKTATLNNRTTVPAYFYCINSINLNGGGKTLTVNTLDSSNQRQMVIFHVTGNVNVQGNAKILHQCPMTGNPVNCTTYPNYRITDFNLYGRAPAPTGGFPLPQICLAGGSYVDAFVLAPEYEYGVAGGGGNGGVRGTVMVKQISNSTGCGSNTSNVVITQTGNWEDQVQGIKPQATAPVLGAFSGWSSKSTSEY